MDTRPHVDVRRLVPALSFLAIGAVALAIATVRPEFGMLVLGAAIGVAGGLLVAAMRSGSDLGAPPRPERAYASGGDIARIPATSVGGLGLIATAAFVAWFLPDGRTLVVWSVTGAALGAGGLIVWRRFYHTTPFEEHPEETLHLR